MFESFSVTVGLEIVKKGIFQSFAVHWVVISQVSGVHSVILSQAESVHFVVASQAESVHNGIASQKLLMGSVFVVVIVFSLRVCASIKD